MAKNNQTNGGKSKRVTRYTYETVLEPRSPETGHTALLPAEEQVVTVPMDNGWTKGIRFVRKNRGWIRAREVCQVSDRGRVPAFERFESHRLFAL